MNRSLLEIYRFILGYNFSAGIKSGLGIFVPLIILLNLDLPFKNILAFCFGAIVISIADQIGPIKHRRTEIAGTWILSTVIAFIGSHLNGQNPYVGIFIVCVTFIGSLSGAFGKKGSSIGFALIFSAILSIKPTEFPIQYTIMTSLGGLTYGLYALIIAYFWQKKKPLARRLLITIFYLQNIFVLYPNVIDKTIALMIVTKRL